MKIKEDMTFEQAREVYFQFEDETAKWSVALHAFPKLPNGLTPDEVRFHPAYREAKVGYEEAAARQRTFNSWFTKKFKKEWRERANRQRPR